MKPKYRTSLQIIKKDVEALFELDLTLSCRKTPTVHARYIYYRLCKDFTYSSLEQIGKEVGKDHSSVVHGLKQFELIKFRNEQQYLHPYKYLKDQVSKKLRVLKSDESFYTIDELIEQNALLHQHCEDLKGFIEKEFKSFFNMAEKIYGYKPQTAVEKYAKLKTILEKIT